jgi:hypothetical protein
VHLLFIEFRKTYDSVGKQVLYNIFIQFEAAMKLVRLIRLCLNGTYSKVCGGKHLPDMFAIQNGLKHGEVLLPLLSNNVGLKFTYKL